MLFVVLFLFFVPFLLLHKTPALKRNKTTVFSFNVTRMKKGQYRFK